MATAMESLEPLLPILNAFIHRHKNQHSSTHWYRYVPILRRSIRNLLATYARPKVPLAKKATTAQDLRLQRYARWLQTRVVPRCFLTFSQLAADNQHAPLGLLLLSLLARLHSTLQVLLLPSVRLVPQLPDSSSTTRTTTKSAAQIRTASKDQQDRGTVIARPPPSAKNPAKTTTLPARDSASTTTSQDELLPKKADKLEERKALPIEDEGPAPRKCDKGKDSKYPKLKAKEKKKKKAGDAFSDMFDGL